MKIAILAVGALVLASPAAAQDAGKEPSVFDGDYLSVGVGAGYEPTYTGSDDYHLSPIGLVQGSLHGIGIESRTNGVALNFVPGRPGKVALKLGIVGDLRFERTHKTHDPVVDRLGKLHTAVELGPTVGVSVPHVLDAYDSLTFAIDALWDVSGQFHGMDVSPHVNYQTPLSRGILASVGVHANYGDDKFADHYFSINPAGSAASGLPVFNAKGGFNEIGTTLFMGFDLDGDLANGGPALFAVGGYSRVLGDARRSPLTSIRGTPNQWFIGAGVGYTF